MIQEIIVGIIGLVCAIYLGRKFIFKSKKKKKKGGACGSCDKCG